MRNIPRKKSDHGSRQRVREQKMAGGGNDNCCDTQICQSEDVVKDIGVILVPLGAEIRILNVKGHSHQTPSYSEKYASWYLFFAARTNSSSA